MSTVHARAEVSSEARLGAGVEVGPFVVVEADVTVGAGTVLLPGTVLLDGSRVGARCRLGPYATVAGRPSDRDFAGERSFAVLEDDVELRDFATVQRATGEDRETRIGAGSLVMSYASVSHNVRLGPGVSLTNLVQLGGHAEIGAGAGVGGGVLVHQFTRVGRLAMVGGGSLVNLDVLPFTLASGSMVEHFRSNRVGLERAGLSTEARTEIQRALRLLRRRDRDAFEDLAATSEVVAEIAAFLAASRRGVAPFRGRA